MLFETRSDVKSSKDNNFRVVMNIKIHGHISMSVD